MAKYFKWIFLFHYLLMWQVVVSLLSVIYKYGWMWTFSGEFIIGRVIKALNNSWHPECFCCDICRTVLAEVGFVKNAGRWTRLTAALTNVLLIYKYIKQSLKIWHFHSKLFIDSAFLTDICVESVITVRKVMVWENTSVRSVTASLKRFLWFIRMTRIIPTISTVTTVGEC